MNDRPIEEARDADLRNVGPALIRAANRALELAAQTGTSLVVSRDGVLEILTPEEVKALVDAQDCSAGGHD